MINKVKGEVVIDGNIYPWFLTEDGKNEVEKLLRNKFTVEGLGDVKLEDVLNMKYQDYFHAMRNVKFIRPYEKLICDSKINGISEEDSSKIIALMREGYILTIEDGKYTLVRLGRVEGSTFTYSALMDLYEFCQDTVELPECKQYRVSEDDLKNCVSFLLKGLSFGESKYLEVSKCIDFLLSRKFLADDLPNTEFGAKVNDDKREVCCRFGLTCSNEFFKLVSYVGYDE